MTITINLPNDIEARLENKARQQHISVEDVVLEILGQALDTDANFLESEDVVAKIQAASGNPAKIRPAVASLAKALRHAPNDADFDLDAWKREWAKVEAEMKATTRVNDIAEGRK